MSGRSRIKLGMLSAVATCIIAGISSSSAFAEFAELKTRCENEGVPSVCLLETLALATGTEEITASIETAQEALLEVPALGLHVTCTEANVTGELEQTNPLVAAVLWKKNVVTFEKCTILGELGEKCELSQPFHTVNVTGEITNFFENETLKIKQAHVLFKPESGAIFVELLFKSKTGQTCPETIAGKQPVKGEQSCVLVNPELPGLTEPIECTEAGSGGLFFGKNAAHLNLKLTMRLKNYKEKFDFSLG